MTGTRWAIAVEDIPPAERLGAVHFVGVGGVGMSGIARIMLARGMQVTGSDAKDALVLTALRALGATVWVGHDAAHVAGADTVVVSAAVRDDNPEVAAARAAGLRLLTRGAALASVMRGRRGVAVAGTHGKTTTTSMLTVALQHCGADPSFAIGGDLAGPASNGHHGSGSLFVAEADESDASFLLLSPDAAIVTNAELDHVDKYPDQASFEAAFREFADCVAPSGFLAVGTDDPGSARLAAWLREGGRDVRTFGFADDADFRLDGLSATPAGSVYAAVWRGQRLGDVRLSVPGSHYAFDSAAALVTGMGLGFGFGDLAQGLAGFTGAKRRLEFKGAAGGIRVIDSYAHHPSELVADLTAARDIVGTGKLVVAFRPLRYSRTAIMHTEIADALGLADEVVVMEVYGAGEDPVRGVSGRLIADEVPLDPEQVVFRPTWATVAPEVAARARPGDLVLTLGAHDVAHIGPEVLDLLARRAGAG